MIKYNFRYRGPFEYDKYVLNIMQYANEIKDFEAAVRRGDMEELKKYGKALDGLTESFSGAEGMLQGLLSANLRLGMEAFAADD